MPSFPYLKILKQAYQLTRSHGWLWIFGLFLGGTSSLNSAVFNLAARKLTGEDIDRLRVFYEGALKWGGEKTGLFFLLVFAALLLLFFLAALSAFAYACVICAAARLTQEPKIQDEPTFRFATSQAKKFFWRVLAVQILVTTGFAALCTVLIAPVAYLFATGALGRAVILLLLALAIFIPASLVFGFLHLFAPIFVVLFDRRIKEAIGLSFGLIRQRLKECVILAAFLLGLSLLFILGLIFSIIVLSLPFATLIWLAARLEFMLAVRILTVAGAILAIIFAAVLNAGFAVFQSAAWVLAVSAMIRTLKLEDQEKALAPEPA